MATYALTNYDDNLIELVINGSITRYIKKTYLKTQVSEPYLTLFWHDSERQPRRKFDRVIDYNDVTSPVSASASALQSTIESWRVAPAVPESSFVNNFTGTVNSTNVTTEELLFNALIPGGTLSAGDAIEVWVCARKSSGASLVTFRVYLNSASTLGGAGSTQYGITTGSTNQTYLNHIHVLFPTATSQVGNVSSTNTPYGVFGNPPSTGTLNVANDIYVQVSSLKVTGTDAFALNGAYVKILKYRP